MSEKTRAGYYCGKIEHLAGRRALVRTGVPGCKKDVLAQFYDPVSLSETTGDPLNFGWHRFSEADFDLDVEYE